MQNFYQATQNASYLQDDRYTLQLMSLYWDWDKWKNIMMLTAYFRVTDHPTQTGFALKKNFNLLGAKNEYAQAEYKDFKEMLGVHDIPYESLPNGRWVIPDYVYREILLKKIVALVTLNDWQGKKYHKIVFQGPAPKDINEDMPRATQHSTQTPLTQPQAYPH